MLADLAVSRLAERLEQVAFGELPPTSPRLRKLLREHGVVADRCQAGAPSTLEQAASNMPCGAFGEPTQRVSGVARRDDGVARVPKGGEPGRQGCRLGLRT